MFVAVGRKVSLCCQKLHAMGEICFSHGPPKLGYILQEPIPNSLVEYVLQHCCKKMKKDAFKGNKALYMRTSRPPSLEIGNENVIWTNTSSAVHTEKELSSHHNLNQLLTRSIPSTNSTFPLPTTTTTPSVWQTWIVLPFSTGNFLLTLLFS